jgi:DNA-directed RNA polymerase specialized sigma24 family protein
VEPQFEVCCFYQYAGGLVLVLASEMKLAEKVAWRIGSKWSAVEIDDLTSHLYLWLVENNRALERWRQEASDGKLYVSLRREAAKYCAREQAARVGRPIAVDNFYTTDLVERALPYIFEDTPQTAVAVNPVTGAPNNVPGEYDVALNLLTDIRQTFYGLNPDIQEVLAWRFRDGLTFEEIGELKGITKDGGKKSVDRAVFRLVNALAGEKL